MNRREFVSTAALGLLAAPLAARAQQAPKVWRIGLLSATSPPASMARIEAFKHGLRELGYQEGQTLAIEYRWGEKNQGRLSALAADLVRLRVDMIVTEGTVATLAARRATTTTPIIFAVAGDPLGAGLVASLARPRGNVTGLAVMGSEMTAKPLQLLREAVPGVARIAVLWNPGNPSSIPELRETETAARALGMQVQSLEVRDARMLDAAFMAMPGNEQGLLWFFRTIYCSVNESRLQASLPKDGCRESPGIGSLPRTGAC